MPMQLYFKRAKCFVHADEGTKKFLAQPGPSAQPVPFWVAETETFKRGITDGSIVNLTPPDQMARGTAKKAVPVEKPAEPVPDDADDNGEEDVEQDELPQAPFGGQPMTPVPAMPKIGSVRPGSGRNK